MSQIELFGANNKRCIFDCFSSTSHRIWSLGLSRNELKKIGKKPSDVKSSFIGCCPSRFMESQREERETERVRKSGRGVFEKGRHREREKDRDR